MDIDYPKNLLNLIVRIKREDNLDSLKIGKDASSHNSKSTPVLYLVQK